MAIDERTRHQPFQRLEEVLGDQEASILMEHLPPVGWADVATKGDLDLRFAAQEHMFRQAIAESESRLLIQRNAQTRLLFFAMIGSILTVASIALAGG